AVVRRGEIERADQALAGLGERDRDHGEMRIAAAVLRLAQDDPRAAMVAVAPVLDGSAPLVWPAWLGEAFLLGAIARDSLGDAGGADRALERARARPNPAGALWCFWFPRARGRRQRPAGRRPAPPPPDRQPPQPAGGERPRAAARRAATAGGPAER